MGCNTVTIMSLTKKYLATYYIGPKCNIGEGNGNPLQYSCLEIPTDRGAWKATSMRSQELDTAQRLNHHQMQCNNGGKITYVFSSVQSLSHVRLFATPWTAALQASLSITNSWSLHMCIYVCVYICIYIHTYICIYENRHIDTVSTKTGYLKYQHYMQIIRAREFSKIEYYGLSLKVGLSFILRDDQYLQEGRLEKISSLVLK